MAAPKSSRYVSVKKSLIKDIEQLITSQETSYKELADRSGLSYDRIKRILRCDYEIRLNDLLLICEGLGNYKLTIGIVPGKKADKYAMTSHNIIQRT